MNDSTAIFLLSDQVRGVMVAYEAHETADRTMCKTLDPNIKVDDFVVVTTDTRWGMTVCKVMETDVEPDFDSTEVVKWIVGVVDTVDHEELKAQEADALVKIKAANKRQKREELRDALIANAGEDVKALPIYTVGKQAES